MTWFAVVLACAGVPVLIVSLYLLALTLLARIPGRAGSRPRRLYRSFVIVVPAHDEGAGLGQALRDLEGLTYPRHLWRTVVVADNCSDDTALVAARHGAGVIIRNDAARRGKGYALDFAFRRLLIEPPSSWQAAVVVDADTAVSPNLLEAVSARFDAGARAVQATYLARSGAGALTTITQVALTAFHVVRSAARERLGLSCGLRGNGMAFTRGLLASKPHAAYTRTEDLEFGVQLGLSGVRVAFAADATVWGEMPQAAGIATKQRERWIGGRMEVARHYLLPLITRAVRRRSWMLADIAIDLVVPPLSVAAAAAALGTALALIALSGGAVVPLAVWGTALLALLLHVLDAALRAGRLWDLCLLAGALPGYMCDKLRITVRAPFRFGSAWVRTARSGELA